MTAVSTTSPAPFASQDKAVIDLIHKLSTVRDTQEIMDIVRHEVRNLLGADGVTFVLRDGDYCYYAEENAIAPLWKGMRFPLAHCISGWSMLNHRSVAIKDIYEDPRIPHDAYKLTFVKSMVMVPVRQDDPIAAIGAYWSKKRMPRPDEITLLETIANAAAVALTNVGLIHSLHGMVEELQQRNKELDIANRARACFLGNMSHELRTPLNIILGFSEGMSRQLHGSLGDERYATYAQEIHNAGRNLLKLIDDMLDLTAMNSGSHPIAMQPTQLSDIVSSCVQLIEKKAHDAKLTLTNTVSDGLPPIKGDPRVLKQIFSNLLLNSIKFTAPNGQITIIAKVDGLNICCSIADTGIGMSKEQIEKATQPFLQGDDRLERQFQGAGLGLALCKGYVDLHGGQMMIESAPKKGTTVTVVFPLLS